MNRDDAEDIMTNTHQFDWTGFYTELAQRLLPYQTDRDELISKVREIYIRTGINLPTLEQDNNIVDIDPFTVFGLFNKSSMKESNRKSIIAAVADLFNVKAPLPTSFDSIPVLNNQNATFYYFVGDRSEHDIDDLWNLYVSALQYADHPTKENREEVSRYFDTSIQQKGNGNSKITMGLYWIAPDSFLNLDQRNVWYIYESGKMPSELVQDLPEVTPKIAASTYFAIVERLQAYLQSGKCALTNFKELSAEAWRHSEEVNKQNRQIRQQEQGKGAAVADEDVQTVRYWLYSPGTDAMFWDEFYKAGIMGLGWDEIGDLRAYRDKNEMRQRMKETIDPDSKFRNAVLATWQFANEINPGDVVFAKRGMHTIVGRGVVSAAYEYDTSRSKYRNVHKVNWTDRGEWEYPGQMAMKTLTDITAYSDQVETLNALFVNDTVEDLEEKEVDYPAYDEEMFLSDVYMDRDSYETLIELVRHKKNVILQGAPGVGKTYAAKRLAYSMMGVKDQSRVMMVQFHQSYSYEDFIMGFRPNEKGFELRRGVFYKFCKAAEADSDNEYFFIIDEINRGNLSKIFGELFMLIENDKRGIELQLLYADEKFAVPENVYIIGLMNTADRSLAMLDYALRRRFAFYEMLPGFETDGFRAYQEGLASQSFDRLIRCVEGLNQEIEREESLGEGFCIGHSYFCNLHDVTNETLQGIVKYELVPLLKEYWFDEPAKVKKWSDSLRSAIQ